MNHFIKYSDDFYLSVINKLIIKSCISLQQRSGVVVIIQDNNQEVMRDSMIPDTMREYHKLP